MEISAKAKRCPHCQSKLRQPTSPVVKVLLVLLGIGFFTSLMFAGTGEPTPQTMKQENPETWVVVYSQLYIEKLLKSPSTADFCGLETVTNLGDNRYKVSSCVDSQNGFGAMIRSKWETTMIYSGSTPENGGSWKVEKIVFDGKVVYGG